MECETLTSRDLAGSISGSSGRWLFPILIVVSLACRSQLATAAEFDVVLEAGVGQSDNITRTEGSPANPAIEETTYFGGIELEYSHDSTRVEADVRGAVTWIEYADDAFDSDVLPALDATALFQLTEQTFSWFFRGNIGQQSVDPFEPVTPDNRQNVTYLTTGPRMLIGLGPRFRFGMYGYFSDMDYETFLEDNQRISGQVGLVRQIAQSRSLALNWRAEKTEFDLDYLFALIERNDAFLEYRDDGSRNSMIINIGWTSIEREDLENDEPLATLEWRRQMSPTTNFTFWGGTRVSDSAQSFRDNQEFGLDYTITQEDYFVSDPFKESFARISYVYDQLRTGVTVLAGWSDEEQQIETHLDRTALIFGLNADHRLGQSWRLTLRAMFSQREFDNMDRDDDDSTYSFTIDWLPSRKLQIGLTLERLERTSSAVGSSYEENRAELRFRYIPTG